MKWGALRLPILHRFVALLYKIIYCFVKSSWGHKFVGNPRQLIPHKQWWFHSILFKKMTNQRGDCSKIVWIYRHLSANCRICKAVDGEWRYFLLIANKVLCFIWLAKLKDRLHVKSSSQNRFVFEFQAKRQVDVTCP